MKCLAETWQIACNTATVPPQKCKTVRAHGPARASETGELAFQASLVRPSVASTPNHATQSTKLRSSQICRWITTLGNNYYNYYGCFMRYIVCILMYGYDVITASGGKRVFSFATFKCVIKAVWLLSLDLRPFQEDAFMMVCNRLK